MTDSAKASVSEECDETARRKAFEAALDLLAGKLLEDEAVLGVKFPYVTDSEGRWKTMTAGRSAGYDGDGWSHGNWFCGFWIGLLLAAYLRTGNSEFIELAGERMQLVARRKDDPNTHDIGFIFLSSALPAFHITGDRWYSDLAMRAAERLRARLVVTPAGSYISSWGPHSDRRGRVSSAIDTMANIPLLYWAAAHTGDGSFAAAGEAHALMTRKAFIRHDYSTYHAVEYDLATGARRRGYTFQGYADESHWSRGQGWAIIGYSATAEATRNPEYLDLACRLADAFLERLGSAAIPPWDFDDPAGDDATRDSSAGAIVANGLLKIAELHADSSERVRRRLQAEKLLYSLCRHALAKGSLPRGLLDHGCYSKPHNDGTGGAVLFGDFYFADALCRILMPGKFSSVAEPFRI
jgi:unsaturated chondroitin disaccharide hydrolase